MESTEKWLPVVGYEGVYEVSDQGRVRSIDRITPHGHRRKGVMRKPDVKNGYHVVELRAGQRRRKYRVHRLVLEAFVGPCPDMAETLHANGNPRDNRLDNLRWGTRSENVKDAVRHGTHNQVSKLACPRGHTYALASPERTSSRVRVCQACKWARQFSRTHDVENTPDIADWFYRTVTLAANPDELAA